MLEIEITTECQPQHLFMKHIESVLEAEMLKPKQEIVCGVCGKSTRIRKVGIPGRIREQKPPTASGQQDLFKE